MKTVWMERDFSYRVGKRNVFVQYCKGREYQRVPEAHAREIVKASAGEAVSEREPSNE